MTRGKQKLEVAFTRTAYSVAEWAQACGLGETTIREHIANGNLVPAYPNTRAIIPLEEGLRWLRTLPDEPPGTHEPASVGSS